VNAVDYPVAVVVTPALADRNRLTAAFRIVLAIPHIVLVGGVGFSVLDSGRGARFGGETGLLGAAALVLAVVSWFTIVIAGSHFEEIRRFTEFYLRWRLRALAYLMLLADRYPPFGDGDYPTAIVVTAPALPRDRVGVGFRLLLAIPHLIVLFFLVCLWWITSIIAWFAILITGAYPPGLYQFGVGVLAWGLRVEAYMLLLVDEYPPFSLMREQPRSG
jgi:hypothetical protein